MVIEKLNEKYVEDAVKLAQAAYDMERKHVEALYGNDYKDLLTNYLSNIFNSKYGAVAVEGGKLIGYLGFWGAINGHFGNVKGSFSPLFANAVGGENRGKTISLLFQHASEEMVSEGILSYAICTYSHDDEITTSLTMNGFGIRCADAVRVVDIPMSIQFNSNYVYEEIHYSDAVDLLFLKNSLIRHLRMSPTYFTVNELSVEDFTALCNRRQSRFFVAKDNSEIIGYIEIIKDGETFISEECDMLNICGAYLQPEYRGKNILQSLLSFVLKKLKEDHIKRIGVDYETINPPALRFWTKYFSNYTYSFVRRIDERILG